MISFFVARSLKKAFSFRGDGYPTLPYWDEEMLGVESSTFFFYSGKWKLTGKRYFVRDVKPIGAAIFFHGLGGGQNSYTKQIAFLAKLGYLVYAYDNTGSGMSEGENIIDLAQCLLDQKAFFAFLDNDEEARGLSRIAMGHSWGGFAALASLQEEYKIEKVVSISGFLSLKSAMVSSRPSIEKIWRYILAYQKRHFGSYAGFDVVPLIKKSKAKILYIGGAKDQVVPKSLSYDILQKECPNVKLSLVEGRGHNPYWTKRSTAYWIHLLNEKHVDTFNRDPHIDIDMELLNETDPAFEKTVIDFLST